MEDYTLKSNDLVVDWLSFKFHDLDSQRQIRIADHLFNLGFNSYQESAKFVKPTQESIMVNSKYRFQVLFVKDNLHWEGTLVHFSGFNASRFYSFAQKQQIDWTLFSGSILSRFDIYYSRDTKIREQSSTIEFFENCHKKLKTTNKNVGFEKNSKGLLLKIGNRRTNNFSRIYQKKNHIRFEMEMKGRFIQSYSKYLMNNDFKIFESQLTKHFFLYFAKRLPLDSIFVDWLVIKLRTIRQYQLPTSYLNSHYICTANDFETVEGRKNFFNLLQFLVFIQDLDYTKDQLGSTSYQLCVFKVTFCSLVIILIYFRLKITNLYARIN